MLFVLAAFAALLGCSALANGPTYIVHGTVTGGLWNITGNASIAVTSGGQTYSISVPASGSSSPFATYSVPAVPKGTYSLTVTFTEATVGPPTGPQTQYSINGGTFTNVTMDSATGPGLGPWVWTVELDNVSISADATIDFDLGCGGC